MLWLSFLPLSRREEKIRELAQQIASATLTEVEAKVSHRLPELSLAEARGYVRARGAGVIRKELDKCLSDQPGLQNARREVQRMASEASVRQVIWQELRQRNQRNSQPELRRAA